MSIVPNSYEEWEHCITVKCGVELTADYVAKRIAALQDGNDHYTRKYTELWGDAQRQQTLEWFREAQKRLAA
ncbi:MAG: hypothetical protein AAGH57_09545 [Pseudomonadota bacterium]